MKTILIGTHNLNKVKEITSLLVELPVQIKTLNDFPDIVPVDETGNTLEENAELKAKTYAKKTNLITIADDTGLEVHALNGAPGVRSARYAGENCSYSDNNNKLIQELKGKNETERNAKFRCVIACYDPEKKRMELADGTIEGKIIDTLQGQHGFGYDPIFFVTSIKKTLAELSLKEKNTLSHRAQALQKAKIILKQWLTQ